MSDQDPRAYQKTLNSAPPPQLTSKEKMAIDRIIQNGDNDEGHQGKTEYHHDDRQSTPHTSTKTIIAIVMAIVVLGLIAVIIWQCTVSSNNNKNSSQECGNGCKGSCNGDSKPSG